jgi:hypothetical protein
MKKDFDMELGQELIDELLKLYYLCEEQCSVIEKIIERLNTQRMAKG